MRPLALALTLAATLLAAGCGDGGGDADGRLPRSGLPDGVELIESYPEEVLAEESPLGYRSPDFVIESVASQSLGVYRGPQGQALYVFVAQCHDADAAAEYLEELRALVIDPETFDVEELAFADDDRAGHHASVEHEHVYQWRDDDHVYEVIGDDPDVVLALADATDHLGLAG